MTVEEAIECYALLAVRVFSEIKVIGEGRFKASNLEAVMKEIVTKHAGHADERMWVEDEAQCKT